MRRTRQVQATRREREREEGVKSGGGGRPRQDVDELAKMNTDDDVADDEVLLPLEVPAG